MNSIWDNAPDGAERVLNGEYFKLTDGDFYYFDNTSQKWHCITSETALHSWESAELRPKEEKAMRFNTGKPELSYLLDAPVAIKGLCEVFAMDAEKYERDNWRKGLDKNQIIDSLLRHLLAYKAGELIDDESGLSHTHHIHWNALVLAEQHSNKE